MPKVKAKLKRNSQNQRVTTDKSWFDQKCKELYANYCKKIHTFNGKKTFNSHIDLNSANKAYKKYACKLKRSYKRQEGYMLCKLKKDNPRKLYSLFREKNQRKCDLNITDFFEYFKELLSSAPNSNKRPEVINNECVFDELDADITADEIIKAIHELKMDKSHGPDCLLNEFFIEYKDFIIPHLCTFFTAVLISGYFPSSWSDAILVPIFKSGDANDSANYRGISLVSNLGKLFTTILNKRLLNWTTVNDILSDAQFGFRNGYSAADAVFCLYSVIQNTLCRNVEYFVNLHRKMGLVC